MLFVYCRVYCVVIWCRVTAPDLRHIHRSVTQYKSDLIVMFLSGVTHIRFNVYVLCCVY